eukprot:scaffold13835_cov81-Skeletonema_dohrnii-CCMP3373.AAC.1
MKNCQVETFLEGIYVQNSGDIKDSTVSQNRLDPPQLISTVQGLVTDNIDKVGDLDGTLDVAGVVNMYENGSDGFSLLG